MKIPQKDLGIRLFDQGNKRNKLSQGAPKGTSLQKIPYHLDYEKSGSYMTEHNLK